MDTSREQIDVFIRRCDELMESRFIIADTKISELLQAIAASDLLYAFFRDVTKSFDYNRAKRQYMNYAPYGNAQKKLLFPQDPEQKLAFIFCLLMEFDNKTCDLGTFLQEYFYEDGSYYESFYALCNQVIKPFRNGVKVMFTDMPQERGKEGAGETESAPQFDLEAERKSVYRSGLSDERKVDALLLLNALEKAKDLPLRAALLCGYLYFARVCGRSEQAKALEQTLRELREEL